MSKRLNDNRAALAMSVDEADALFQALAERTIEATAVAAEHEKQMAIIKAKAAEDREVFQNIIKPLENQLEDYINAHPQRFERPRMRKTEFGQYGLRRVTSLDVFDEDACKASVKAQQIPAIVVTERLDKKAIEKAISDGFDVTGAEIRSGEIMKYVVKKELLDRVK